MTTLAATSDAVSTLDCDALILGVDAAGAVAAHPQLDEQARAALTETAVAVEASGKLGSVTVLPGGPTAARRVVLVGLGEGAEGDVRFAAGSAARSCGKKPGTVVVALPGEGDRALSAIAEGGCLARMCSPTTSRTPTPTTSRSSPTG